MVKVYAHGDMREVANIRSRDVRRRFDRAAAGFDEADFVHRKTFAGLLERLAPVTVEPSMVLDLGSATGRGTDVLTRTYRKSRIIALDLSLPMLVRAKRRGSLLARPRAVQADARALPFRNASIDLAVANLLLPWIGDPDAVFTELARVLRPGGVFAFATLGPDSFGLLRDAWSAVDPEAHVGDFTDMHVIGDALVSAGLADPVLDVDRLTVSYRDTDSLVADLVATGTRNPLAARRKSLTGRDRIAAFRSAIDARSHDGKLAVELELVYGHAWGAGPRPPAGEFHVVPGAITRRRRR